MKEFVGFVGFVLVIGMVLSFSWFAWDKVESHDNVDLRTQIEQLERELEDTQGSSEKWKAKFLGVKCERDHRYNGRWVSWNMDHIVRWLND